MYLIKVEAFNNLNIPQILTQQKISLANPFTEQEVRNAINGLRLDASSGLMGFLRSGFCLQDILVPILTEVSTIFEQIYEALNNFVNYGAPL